MLYANIIVDISHEKLDKSFQYIIPAGMEDKIHAGVLVNIPFGKGNKVITGYVIEVTNKPEFDVSKMKSIIEVAPKSVPIEAKLIGLASYIKKNYGSTMNQALKTVIPVKIQTKQIEKRKISLKISGDELSEYRTKFEKRNAVARLRLIDELILQTELSYELVTNKLNVSSKTIKELGELGIIEITSETMYRNPVKNLDVGGYDIELNEQQKKVVEDIEKSDKVTHLIHGITGSGKTEVYIKLIENTLNKGNQAIVLIPEIALTYQTVMRFYKKFGDKVAIVNSKLSAGEKYDQFERAKNGQVSIMIGPRSAIFTPFKKIGLVIIDEEHEGSYKSENIPKYHAREVAIYRAKLDGGKVILGSATPSIEAYYRAKTGVYELHNLSIRAKNAQLAKVLVVDLREELKEGNKTIFSKKLNELILDRLGKKQQIILFINRRGYAGFVSCRSCGKVMKCPHCDVGLTFHNNNTLVCHYCNHTIPMPKLCPECDSKYIATFGTGTQKVEEMVKKFYPSARVLRMDMDTTSRKGGHEQILSSFAAHEADILIGTQMIVKGHDFPMVTLVGVVAADLSLYASDYRATERTFQLLTQAAGRAGRGEEEGEVVIQTYSPENYGVETASNQDYVEYYEKEIMYRTLMDYPPVVSMVGLLIASKDEKVIDTYCIQLGRNIKELVEELDIKMIGPADANVAKIKDVHRKMYYFKQGDYNKLVELKDFIEQCHENYERKNLVSIQFEFD